MGLTNISNQREFEKFVETSRGTAVKVANADGSNVGASVTDGSSLASGSAGAPFMGVYQTSPDALVDGELGIVGLTTDRSVRVTEQLAPVAEDNANGVIAQIIKPVAGSTYAASSFAVIGSDVDVSVKATPGNLLSIVVSNSNATTRYLQIHNVASAPTTGNAPIISLPIWGNSRLELGRNIFGEGGKYLSTGIGIAVSVYDALYSTPSAAQHHLYGEYI